MGIELTVAANGRVVIPADVRKALGLERGGKVTLDVDEYGMRLSTAQQRVRKAQALTAHIMRDKPTITVDDFLADKRAESLREEERFARSHP